MKVPKQMMPTSTQVIKCEPGTDWFLAEEDFLFWAQFWALFFWRVVLFWVMSAPEAAPRMMANTTLSVFDIPTVIALRLSTFTFAYEMKQNEWGSRKGREYVVKH